GCTLSGNESLSAIMSGRNWALLGLFSNTFFLEDRCSLSIGGAAKTLTAPSKLCFSPYNRMNAALNLLQNRTSGLGPINARVGKESRYPPRGTDNSPRILSDGRFARSWRVP